MIRVLRRKTDNNHVLKLEFVKKHTTLSMFFCNYYKLLMITNIQLWGGIVKKTFPGEFGYTPRQFENLWKNAIIVPDTNVLLNVYKLSEKTRKDFFKIFELMKDRLWIPYQVADEYFANRLNEISKHEKEYEKMINQIKTVEDNLQSTKQHPFINDKLMKKVKKDFEEVKKELEKNCNEYHKIIRNDYIKNKFSSLLKNKVGEKLDNNELKDIFREGKERYNMEIPPGFMDETKSIENRKYGDLIIWKEIIKKSTKEKKDIIFITDDRKKDWWLIYNYKDEIVSPHPKLINEFMRITRKKVFFYSSDKFMEYASKFLKEKIEVETINEMRDIREFLDLDILKKALNVSVKKMIEEEYLKEKKDILYDEISAFEDRLRDLKNRKRILTKSIYFLNQRKNKNMLTKKELVLLEAYEQEAAGIENKINNIQFEREKRLRKLNRSIDD